MAVVATDTNIITELEENVKKETPGKDAQDKGEAGEDKGRSRDISRALLLILLGISQRW